MDARQSSISTAYANVPGAVIPASNLIVGKKYLLVVTGVMDSTNQNAACQVRLAHGGTSFAESQHREEPDQPGQGLTYFYMTVWTAVSGEDLTLQMRNEQTGQAFEVGIAYVRMIALQLSDDFVEGTDWAFNEVLASTTLTNTESASNNASLTITPANANDWWWIMGSAQENIVDLTLSYQSRLLRTGEATETLCEIIKEGEDTVVAETTYLLPTMSVVQLGAVSNTFTEKSLLSAAGTTEFRTRSAVFAFNLSKFRYVAAHRTVAAIDLSATPFATQVESVTLDPMIAGDVWAIGFFVHDPNTTNAAQARLQVDGVNDPAQQTDRKMEQCHDVRDQSALVVQSLSPQSAAPHTYALQGSTAAAAAGRAAIYRSLFAVSLELANTVELFPAFDVTDGLWLNELGSATDLNPSIGEAVPNASTWIQNEPNLPISSMAEVKLSDPGRVPAAGTVTLAVRYSTP